MRITVTVKSGSPGVFADSPQVVTADVRVDEGMFGASELADLVTTATSNASSLVFSIAGAFGATDDDPTDDTPLVDDTQEDDTDGR